jgi:SAM-dependent methyltransferase
VKVNIGCGATPTQGWTNFDNSLTVRVARWPAAIRVLRRARVLTGQSYKFAVVANSQGVRFANAAQRIPCANNSVEAVYSSHMIEHLDRREAQAFLLEVRRILIPGGIVRLAVPDLARFLEQYQITGDADEFVTRTRMSQARPEGLVPRVKLGLIGPRNHLWMYDGRSLSQLLHKIGFTDVCVMPPGKTNITDPGHLDLEERVEQSVYVEAFQPV